MDARGIVATLTVEQKAALCLGGDFWHTAAVDGVEQIAVSDGPHGLRKQTGTFFDPSVPATCFPTASCLAGSWDPGLISEVGAALGEQAKALDIAVVLGPGINIKRHPLCGRNFEYYSEDPYLAGRLAVGAVRGIQSSGTGACVKHFAANNQETDRMRVSADIDERTLREIYLPAFEHVITTAEPWMVMTAYNRLNGVYTSHDPWLLTQVLRDEWGFAGVVVSDWGAVHDRVVALKAGLDLEMPPNLGFSDKALVDAVASGDLDESALDEAATRVVSLTLRAGTRSHAAALPPDLAAAHHRLARRAAAESMILLKNEGDLLPLTAPTIAVVGERHPAFQGGGSSRVNPVSEDDPVAELAAALPTATFTDDPTDADVIIAFLGFPAGAETEGADRADIDLPAEQISLLQSLSGRAPIVAVICSGSVIRTSTWGIYARAIVQAGLAGEAAGGAIADVLTGRVNPSGKLTETIPLRIEDCPAYLNFPGEEGHVRYGEGVFTGYRGYDEAGTKVGYPFGHGLSYTTFDYSDLAVSGREVSCVVANTGDRAGAEVVQLYVGDPVSRVRRPLRELKGFAKLFLEPGASERVTFTLTDRDLSYWSRTLGGWVLEPGEFRVEVGSSSRDIRLSAVINIDGPPPRFPLTIMSTVSEWLADPEGRDRLYATIKEVTGEEPADFGPLADMIGTIPLAALTAFPIPSITPAVLEALK
ncbi:MAG: glycoside hydrolase family 3 N-terminal domain-containing protein [Streptosporangiaceae bacterium]|jgi:beta-glucosidase